LGNKPHGLIDSQSQSYKVLLNIRFIVVTFRGQVSVVVIQYRVINTWTKTIPEGILAKYFMNELMALVLLLSILTQEL
jgi:hypothetical protein